MTAQRHHTQIDLNAVFEALERPLALVDDPERRAAFQRYLESARIYLERSYSTFINCRQPSTRRGNASAAGISNGHFAPPSSRLRRRPQPSKTVCLARDSEKVTIRLCGAKDPSLRRPARGSLHQFVVIREPRERRARYPREMRQSERRQQREARTTSAAQREQERDRCQEERQAERQLRGFIGGVTRQQCKSTGALSLE
jgi:hypothetical protein